MKNISLSAKTFVMSVLIAGALFIYALSQKIIISTAQPRAANSSQQTSQTTSFWKPYATLQSIEAAPYTAVTFSQDSKFLITCDANGSIELWNLEKKTAHNKLKLQTQRTKLAFSPDNTQFACCSKDNSISIWSWPDLQELHTLEGHKKKTCDDGLCNKKNCCCFIRLLSYANNGKELISGSSKDGLVNSWDTQSGKLLRTIHIKTNDSLGIESLVLSPDAHSIASTESITYYPPERDSKLDPNMSYDYQEEIFINIFDCATGKKTKKISTKINDYARNSCPSALCFSPSGTYLAVSDSKGIIHVINTKNWSVNTAFDNSSAGNRRGDLEEQYNIQFSPQEDQIAATIGHAYSPFDDDNPRLALIWDLKSGAFVQKFNYANQVAFSPNGKLFAVCTVSQPKSNNQTCTIEIFSRE